jgi:putative hydrolase of the HAD superfamily
VDYIKSDIDSLRILAKSLPVKLDANAFIDIAVEQIMKFHDLVNDGKVEATNIHNYRLYNTLQYFSVEWKKEYVDIYLQHFIQSTVCFSGAEKVIEYLYGKVKLGILSNAYNSEEQKRRINNTGIARFFDDIVVCADIGAYKPSKEVFLYLVNKYGLAPNECIYIGDSEEYDIKGSREAGLYTIKMVHNPLPKNSIADFICVDFDDLYLLLAGVLSRNNVLVE